MISNDDDYKLFLDSLLLKITHGEMKPLLSQTHTSEWSATVQFRDEFLKRQNDFADRLFERCIDFAMFRCKCKTREAFVKIHGEVIDEDVVNAIKIL